MFTVTKWKDFRAVGSLLSIGFGNENYMYVQRKRVEKFED